MKYSFDRPFYFPKNQSRFSVFVLNRNCSEFKSENNPVQVGDIELTINKIKIQTLQS